MVLAPVGAAASPLPIYVANLADETMHSYGDAAAARQIAAEVAWLETPRPGLELAAGPVLPEPEPPAKLPEDLKRWPPGPRYAVADLERAGAPRPAAVAAVRVIPGALALPADRRRWPRQALEIFWSAVKDLNRDARERGDAVEGRARFALEDAERAVRETWRSKH